MAAARNIVDLDRECPAKDGIVMREQVEAHRNPRADSMFEPGGCDTDDQAPSVHFRDGFESFRQPDVKNDPFESPD